MHTKNKRRVSRRKPMAQSSIHPSKLISEGNFKENAKPTSTFPFKELAINQRLLANVTAKGYLNMTPIQEQAFTPLMNEENLIGIAATGTGKTTAFLLPIIQQMLKNQATALVIVPTRELAQQVVQEFKSITKGLKLYSACFIGGTNINKDLRTANQRNDLIVGTPGRIKDLLYRKSLRINQVPILVLDEFDRMLDMGFVNDVRNIVSFMKQRQQSILFSATLDNSQKKLINEFVKDPVQIKINSGSKASDNVKQDIIEVKETENKMDVLTNLLHREEIEKVILFTETKRIADKICKQLVKSGFKSDVIHGNKSQNYRTKAIQLFKDGKTKILVATDVAARGIDIDNVSHVINYQIPRTMDSYIHRIGRTGRAGKLGMAYTFIN